MHSFTDDLQFDVFFGELSLFMFNVETKTQRQLIYLVHLQHTVEVASSSEDSKEVLADLSLSYLVEEILLSISCLN